MTEHIREAFSSLFETIGIGIGLIIHISVVCLCLYIAWILLCNFIANPTILGFILLIVFLSAGAK